MSARTAAAMSAILPAMRFMRASNSVFCISGKLHRSRGADAPESCSPIAPGAGSSAPAKSEGDGAPGGAGQSLCTRSCSFTCADCASLSATAWRLAARRPAVLRRRAALPAFRFAPPEAPVRGPLWAAAPSSPKQAWRPAVSELLAGGRSAPGRNPDAARARGLLSRARGRRPDPREPEQPVRVPSRGRARWNIYLVRRAGISYHANVIIVLQATKPLQDFALRRGALPRGLRRRVSRRRPKATARPAVCAASNARAGAARAARRPAPPKSRSPQ